MDEGKPSEYNKVLQCRGKFFILLDFLASVCDTQLSFQEVIFSERHESLK